MLNKKLLRISTVPHSLDLLLKGQLKYMKGRGLDVYMLSSPGKEVPAIEEREGVPHIAVPLSRSLNPLADLVSLWKLVSVIKKLRPDIVHSHSPKAGTIGMLAAWLCRVPVKIHTVAGLPLMETTGGKRKLLMTVERWTYRFADWVIPNSMELRDFIVKEKLISNGNKLKVLGRGSSNGIDLKYFCRSEEVLQKAAALKQTLQIQTDNTVLCFVGRLAFYKGINELVSAFKQLSAKHPKLKLLLVGPFEDLNPLEQETLDYIKENKNIIVTGHQHDIRPYLALSDIFVFPSYREGFPQSLMQACAMQLPCITTNINGCNEIVFDGVNGLLVPAKSVDALVDACEKLISDKTLRLSLAAAGRGYIEEHFEQQTFWNEIYNFYTEVQS